MAELEVPADGPQPDPKPAAKDEPPKQPEEKTVTLKQSELDQMIQDRALRATAAKYPDYDVLKAKAEKFDASQEEQKTEIERANEAKSQAEKERDAARSEALATKRETAILVEASKQGADADTVQVLLANSEDIVVQDGKVVGVSAAVAKLLEEKPHLKLGTPRASGAGDFGGNDGPSVPDRIRELEKKGDKASLAEARDLKYRSIADSLQKG